jgi:hypothetical protein
MDRERPRNPISFDTARFASRHIHRVDRYVLDMLYKPA